VSASSRVESCYRVAEDCHAGESSISSSLFSTIRAERICGSQAGTRIRESVSRVIPSAKLVHRQANLPLIVRKSFSRAARAAMAVKLQRLYQTPGWKAHSHIYAYVNPQTEHVLWNIIRKVDFVLSLSKYSRYTSFVRVLR